MLSYQLRKPSRFGNKRTIVGMVYELTFEEVWQTAYEYAETNQLDLLLYKGDKCLGELRFKHMQDKQPLFSPYTNTVYVEYPARGNTDGELLYTVFKT